MVDMYEDDKFKFISKDMFKKGSSKKSEQDQDNSKKSNVSIKRLQSQMDDERDLIENKAKTDAYDLNRAQSEAYIKSPSMIKQPSSGQKSVNIRNFNTQQYTNEK